MRRINRLRVLCQLRRCGGRWSIKGGVQWGIGKKRKLSKKRKLIENKGKLINFAEIGGIYKSCPNRGKCLYFVEIEGEYAICIIGLIRGMDAPGGQQRKI